MSSEKAVPIAYVTKYATTEGIIVICDGNVVEGKYLSKGHLFVNGTQWTEDKAEAEKRWRAALLKSAESAEKKAKKLRAAAALAPKYTER